MHGGYFLLFRAYNNPGNKRSTGVSKYILTFMMTSINDMYISKKRLQTFVHLETGYCKAPGYEYTIFISKQENYHKWILNNTNPLWKITLTLLKITVYMCWTFVKIRTCLICVAHVNTYVYRKCKIYQYITCFWNTFSTYV